MTISKDNLIEKEKKILSSIRLQILQFIENNHINDNELASKLDMLPVGIKILFEKKYWGFDTTFIIASKLGFNFNVNLSMETVE